MLTLENHTVLGRLKSETAALHDRLERVVDLLNPAIDGAGYASLLAGFHAFYQPVEARIFGHAGWAGLGFDPQPRRKLHLLELDLRFLGMEPPPPCPEPPRLQTFPEALGALYVLEGATLGGQVIGRHLRAHLGLGPENGAAFFHSYGERVGPMWREFRGFLAEQARSVELEDRMVAGALETFGRFGDWLEGREGRIARGG